MLLLSRGKRPRFFFDARRLSTGRIVRAPLFLCFRFPPILIALAILLIATFTEAGTTWDGGGANSLWSNAVNWNPDGVPANNGTSSLAFAGTTRLTPDMDANWSINSLTFNSGAGAFTLGSTGSFTLTIQGGGITNNSASTETINNAITLGAAQTWSATSGALSFGGSIANGGFLLTIGGTANTAASGVISGAGGLTKNGTGTLTLSGTNTYSGGTTFNAGTVSISSDANLGASSGSLTFNGGTLSATNNVIGTRAIVMTGAGVFSVAFGKTLEESGAVSGNGNLSVGGSGTLILSGSGSNGTGTTTLTSGVLSLRGTVSLGTGNLNFVSGVLELGNGNFTRALGVGAGQVNMSSASGGAGFAAYGADRIVNLGGAGATVTWGSGNFVASGQPLYLGDPTADHMVDFQNPINLNGAVRTITVTQGVGTGPDAKISGIISGTGASGLVINAVGVAPWNPGTLVLSGANTYSGGTTLTAGTLDINSTTALGTGAFVINGGTIDNTTGSSLTLANNNVITLGGSFTFGGTNDLSLGTGAVSISADQTITLNGTNSMLTMGSLANTTNGSGRIITVNGAGNTLVLGGYTIAANNSNRTGTFNGNGNVTITGAVVNGGSSTSGLTYSGTGTLTLSGANTYTGATTISSGTLQLGNGGTTGSLSTSSAITDNGNFTINRNNAITQGTDFSGSALTGTGSFTQAGTGITTLNVANTYTGLTTVTAGTLLEGVSNAISTGALTVNGSTATFDLGANHTDSVGTVTLDGGGAINGTGTSALTSTGTFEMKSGTVNAILAGSGIPLNKTTSGTVTLSGADTYTGATTINAGTLNVTGSLASGSAVTVNNSGSVLEGTGTIYGSVSIASNGAILEAGTGSTGQTLTMRGAVTMGSGSVLELALGASGTHSTLAIGVGGTISFQSLQKFNIIDLGVTSGSTYTGLITGIGSNPGTESGWTITNQNWTYNFSYDSANGGEIDLNVTALPEPSTYVTGVLTLLAVGYSQRVRLRRVIARS